MKLEINMNRKIGVINIISNSFVLEDLKAHICKKMKLNESDFKMKISFADVPKIELIEILGKKPQQETPKKVLRKYADVEKEIRKQLIGYWKGLAMDCDSDVMSVPNSRQLNYDEKAFISSRDHRIVLKVYSKANEVFYIGFRKSVIYLIVPMNEKGNDVKFVKLFDMKSESSVHKFMVGEAISLEEKGKI